MQPAKQGTLNFAKKTSIPLKVDHSTNFLKFLATYKKSADNNGPYTTLEHCVNIWSMGGMPSPGRWSIPISKYDEFLKLQYLATKGFASHYLVECWNPNDDFRKWALDLDWGFEVTYNYKPL